MKKLFFLFLVFLLLAFCLEGCSKKSHCASYSRSGSEKKSGEGKSPFSMKSFSLFSKKKSEEGKSPFSVKSLFSKKKSEEGKNPFSSKSFSLFGKKKSGERATPFSTKSFSLFSKKKAAEGKNPFAVNTSERGSFFSSLFKRKGEDSPFATKTKEDKESTATTTKKKNIFGRWWALLFPKIEKSPFAESIEKKKKEKKKHEEGIFPAKMLKNINQ